MITQYDGSSQIAGLPRPGPRKTTQYASAQDCSTNPRTGTSTGGAVPNFNKALLMDNDKARAMRELEEFLSPRVEDAYRDKFVDKSVSDIAKEVYKELRV
ncbi:MAG: hypothetical protein L3K26_02365 [Candidatus Hydrogenedentes bacterium]|nr:hypothetical protein [Candidatus Hydrogenedentota bacterium]